MKDYTKLTDSELLQIIDSSDVESEDFRSIKELSATDSIFRSRVIEFYTQTAAYKTFLHLIKFQIKSVTPNFLVASGNDLISLLEESISNSTDEEVKKYFTEKLSTIKSILNK